LEAAAVAAAVVLVAEDDDALEEEAAAFDDEATAATRERVTRTARAVDAETTMGMRFFLLLSLSESPSESSESESSSMPSTSTDRGVLIEGVAGRALPLVRRAVRVGLVDENEETDWLRRDSESSPTLVSSSDSTSSGGGVGVLGAGAGLARRMPRSFRKLVKALVGPRTLLTYVVPAADRLLLDMV